MMTECFCFWLNYPFTKKNLVVFDVTFPYNNIAPCVKKIVAVLTCYNSLMTTSCSTLLLNVTLKEAVSRLSPLDKF